MTADLSTRDPPSIEARLIAAIHENGRLADQLNRATAELAAERGFLANARARADQAEIDRDEWRQAAEAAIGERKLAEALVRNYMRVADANRMASEAAQKLAEGGAGLFWCRWCAASCLAAAGALWALALALGLWVR